MEPISERYPTAAQVFASVGSASRSPATSAATSRTAAPTPIAIALLAVGWHFGKRLTTTLDSAIDAAPARIAAIEMIGTAAPTPSPNTKATPTSEMTAPSRLWPRNRSWPWPTAKRNVRSGTSARTIAATLAGAFTRPK